MRTKEVIGDDLLIHSKPLKTGYHVNLTESSFLSITPVVENPDPDADPSEAYLDRTTIEQQLFGRYYFFPDWGFFRIAAHTSGLPADYFSPQKRMMVPPEKVTPFLKEYRDVLRADPSVFIDNSLLDHEIVENYERVTVDHKEFSERRGRAGNKLRFRLIPNVFPRDFRGETKQQTLSR